MLRRGVGEKLFIWFSRFGATNMHPPTCWVVLQKDFMDEKLLGKEVSYAATTKSWWIKEICPITSPFFTPWTCPLRTIFIASYPLNVRRAVLKDLNPMPTFTNRLIGRCSCSIILFKYFFCRSSVASLARFITSQGLNGFRTCGILIHGNHAQCLSRSGLQDLAEKSFCCFPITFRTQHAVQCVAYTIYRSIEILPHSQDAWHTFHPPATNHSSVADEAGSVCPVLGHISTPIDSGWNDPRQSLAPASSPPNLDRKAHNDCTIAHLSGWLLTRNDAIWTELEWTWKVEHQRQSFPTVSSPSLLATQPASIVSQELLVFLEPWNPGWAILINTTLSFGNKACGFTNKKNLSLSQL